MEEEKDSLPEEPVQEVPALKDAFAQVDLAIEENRLTDAESLLEGFEEHGAEWHYYKSRVSRKKNWNLDAYMHVKEALRLEPENETYRKDFEELDRQMQPDGGEGKKKRKKKNMGSDSGEHNECGECCASGCCMCACEGLCEGICEGC